MNRTPSTFWHKLPVFLLLLSLIMPLSNVRAQDQATSSESTPEATQQAVETPTEPPVVVPTDVPAEIPTVAPTDVPTEAPTVETAPPTAVVSDDDGFSAMIIAPDDGGGGGASDNVAVSYCEASVLWWDPYVLKWTDTTTLAFMINNSMFQRQVIYAPFTSDGVDYPGRNTQLSAFLGNGCQPFGTSPAMPTLSSVGCGVIPDLIVPPNGNHVTYFGYRSSLNGSGVVTFQVLTDADWGWVFNRQALLDAGWSPSNNVDGTSSDASITLTYQIPPCSATPTAPTTTNGNCTAGVWTPPTVTLPANTSFIAYSVSPISDTGVYTATASLTSSPYVVSFATPLPTGWVFADQFNRSASFTGTVSPNRCAAVTPVNPTVTNGSCVNGVYTAPRATSATTSGITYTVSPITSSGSFTVTASLTFNAVFTTPLPAGWTLVSGGRSATFAGSVNLNPCIAATPVHPETTDGSCIDGVYTAPAVSAGTTSGITYQVTPISPTGGYSVTATLATNAIFGNLSGTGWVASANGRSATFIGTVGLNPCVIVTPENPTSTAGSCVDGVYTEPTATPSVTIGITYEIPAIGSNGSYSVTATLATNANFVTALPDGWTLAAGGRSATFTGSVALNQCVAATPIAPDTADGVCAGGTYTAPSVVPAGDTSAIAYTAHLNGGGTYVVTATLASNAIFGTLTETGWTIATDGRSATTSGTLARNQCVSVSGTVVQQGNQRPVAGAKVCLAELGFCTTTSANGTYTIAMVPSGTSTLTITATGYKSVSTAIVIGSTDATLQTIVLSKGNDKPR